MRIFIVDDSPLLRGRLIELLSEVDGVEVAGEARGTPGALDAIRALAPEVVTLDIETAGGGGLELLRRVRDENPGLVVIILTNLASPPYRKRCEQAGADFFIDKAIEIDEVRRIIRDLLPRFARQGG